MTARCSSCRSSMFMVFWLHFSLLYDPEAPSSCPLDFCPRSGGFSSSVAQIGTLLRHLCTRRSSNSLNLCESLQESHGLVSYALPRTDTRDRTPPKIRFIRSCSSPLSPDLFRRLKDTYKTSIVESYGMTEAAHLVCSSPLEPGRSIPGSVGPAQGVDLRIMDPNGGEVERGLEGEVGIRGPNIMKGYRNNEETNMSCFTADGFFRTGDHGKMNKEDYLIITGKHSARLDQRWGSPGTNQDLHRA